MNKLILAPSLCFTAPRTTPIHQTFAPQERVRTTGGWQRTSGTTSSGGRPSPRSDSGSRGRFVVVRPLSSCSPAPWGLFKPDTMRWEVQQVIADDANVAVGVTLRCLTTNDDPDENHYCFVFRHVEGRAVEAWEYTDTAHVFALVDP